MRYTNIDEAAEAARNRDLDAYLSEYDGTDPAPLRLSERIREIHDYTLRMDGGDLLLYDIPFSTERLRDLLADAQEQLEVFPNHRSVYFQYCAEQITRALLHSLETNLDK